MQDAFQRTPCNVSNWYWQTVNLLTRKFADDIRPYYGKIIMWNRNETDTINEQTTTILENPRTIHTIWRRQNADIIEGDKPGARADHNKLQELWAYFENGIRCDF